MALTAWLLLAKVEEDLQFAGLCTPEEFMALLDDVDAEDGQRDGRAPV